jgi:hypothetical protein
MFCPVAKCSNHASSGEMLVAVFQLVEILVQKRENSRVFHDPFQWNMPEVRYMPVLSHFLQREAGHKKTIEQGLANAEWPKHQKLFNKDEIATWFVSPLISLHFQWCGTWPQETASW